MTNELLIPRYDDREDRVLGPELVAEGWRSIGDWIHWLHIPSHRSVSVEDFPWENCHGIPAWPEPPADAKTEGWVVSCRVHDDHGNPIKGTAFWIESWGEAVRRARLLRESILAESQPKAYAEQMTLDDALPSEKRGGS